MAPTGGDMAEELLLRDLLMMLDRGDDVPVAELPSR
jgi:hypothetical protein